MITRKHITCLLLVVAALAGMAQNKQAKDSTTTDTASGEYKYQRWKETYLLKEAEQKHYNDAVCHNKRFNYNNTICKADYIFEGKTIKQSRYTRDNKIVASKIVKVTKVIKGNLLLANYEIIIPINDPEVVSISGGRYYDPQIFDTLSLFFCRKATEYPYNALYNIDSVSDKNILTYCDPAIAVYFVDDVITGMDTIFRNKADVYKYFFNVTKNKKFTLSKEEMADTLRQEEIIGGKIDRKRERAENIQKERNDDIDSTMREKYLPKKVIPADDTTSYNSSAGSKDSVVTDTTDLHIYGNNSSLLKSNSSCFYNYLKLEDCDHPDNQIDNPLNVKMSYIGQIIPVFVNVMSNSYSTQPYLESVTSLDGSVAEKDYDTNFNGDGFYVALKLNGEGSTRIDFTVSYDAPTVWDDNCTVTETGNITPHISLTLNVTPQDPVTGLTLSPSSTEATVGDVVTINAVTNPLNPTIPGVTWSIYSSVLECVSSNNDYADVRITEYNTTEQTVSATAIDDSKKTFTAKCKIKIKPKHLDNLLITKDNTDFTGKTIPARCTALSSFSLAYTTNTYASVRNVVWSSSNPEVASINSSTGVVTPGIITGNTTITLVCYDMCSPTHSLTKTCTINVKPKINKMYVMTSNAVSIDGNYNVAGVDNILVIEGGGFGDSRGANGRVVFPTADDGGLNTVEDNDTYDYIDNGWTQTQIKIKLPSGVYNYQTNTKIRIGGGLLSVKTNDNLAANDYDFKIPYVLSQYISTENYKFPHVIANSLTTNNEDMEEISFKIDQSIVSSSDKDNYIKIIKRVINDWACIMDKVNITLKDNAANVIRLKTVDAKAGAAYSPYSSQYSSDISGIYYKYNDININPTPGKPWDFSLPPNCISAGSASLYIALLHEFGHLLGLSHVNDSKDLMYYQIG